MALIETLLRCVLWIAALFAVWALLSGKFDAMHLGLGALTAVLLGLYYFPWRRDRHLPLVRLALFIPWLLWQILLSNLRVARLVLSPRPVTAPVLIRRASGVCGNRALTILGCAITLTPGTLTVEIDEHHMLIHALDAQSHKEIEEGVMSRQVARVFGQEWKP